MHWVLGWMGALAVCWCLVVCIQLGMKPKGQRGGSGRRTQVRVCAEWMVAVGQLGLTSRGRCKQSKQTMAAMVALLMGGNTVYVVLIHTRRLP